MAGARSRRAPVLLYLVGLDRELARRDSGGEPAVTGQDGRDTLEIVCAVYESSRTGRTVSLGR